MNELNIFMSIGSLPSLVNLSPELVIALIDVHANTLAFGGSNKICLPDFPPQHVLFRKMYSAFQLISIMHTQSPPLAIYEYNSLMCSLFRPKLASDLRFYLFENFLKVIVYPIHSAQSLKLKNAQ